MSDTTQTRPSFGRLDPAELAVPNAVLQRNWGWLLALGIALIVGGTAALVMPFFASAAILYAIAAAMAVGGAFQIVQAFRCEGWKGRGLATLSAILYLAGAVLIALNPLAGLLAIALVIGALFLVDGGFRIAMGLRMRPEEGWGWITLGGVLSAALGVLIALAWPAISLTIVGILAGISFIFEGWGFVFIALAARRGARAEETHA